MHIPSLVKTHLHLLKLSYGNEHTDGRTTERQTDGQTDGHTDSQHETIIPHYYRVAGYKDGSDLYNFFCKNIFGFFLSKNLFCFSSFILKDCCYIRILLKICIQSTYPIDCLYILHLILLWEKMKEIKVLKSITKIKCFVHK